MEKYRIDVVPEANDDDDVPACWSMVCGQIEGKTHWIWICRYHEDGKDTYAVENSNGYNLVGKEYKTFRGAVKKAKEIADKQDRTKNYSD